MSKRPFRITFRSSDGNDLDSFEMVSKQYQTLTGYSVSLESFVATGLIFNGDLTDYVGFRVLMSNGLVSTSIGYLPENVYQDGVYGAPLTYIPFNSLTVPNERSTALIWTNPDTWGTRTKTVFSLYQNTFMNFQTITGSITQYTNLEFTLAFYDEQVSSNEPQTDF